MNLLPRSPKIVPMASCLLLMNSAFHHWPMTLSLGSLIPVLSLASPGKSRMYRHRLAGRLACLLTEEEAHLPIKRNRAQLIDERALQLQTLVVGGNPFVPGIRRRLSELIQT